MKQSWLQGVINSIADRGRELLGLDSGHLGTQELHELCIRLLSGRGEASGIALSQAILHHYSLLDDENKLAFFKLLESEFNPDFSHITQTMDHYRQSRSADDLIALTQAIEAPRQELFRRLNMAPDGTAGLVSLRADLLNHLRNHAELKSVDADLKHLLASWFNRGFLQLINIDWNSPAQVLEKIIGYEAVHEIRGWDDLRRRLMKDRRCFAFVHPAMPDEPLIFVEVALVQGLSSEVGSLLDPESPVLHPQNTDTAIFYSINNTQAGLRGISFGNFLIKQVLTDLAHECPWLKTSSTLSPLPRFRKTLEQWLSATARLPFYTELDSILERHEKALHDLAPTDSDRSSNRKLLAAILDTGISNQNARLGSLLSELALSYLTFAQTDGALADNVAMFHLSNGARLERLNPFADMSSHGQQTAYGMMVNYLYDLNDVELNHEAFVSKGEIAMSDNLAKLFRKFDRPHA